MMDDVAKRPRNLKNLWQQHGFNVICVSAAAISAFFVYHFFSDGDFSFLMTLGSLLTLFSFGLLAAKAVAYRNSAGLSLKSLQCYALVYAGRLASILFYEGYLPYDRSGDWFYQACEILSLALVLGLLAASYLVFKRRAADTAGDSFGNFLVPTELGVLWLLLPSLALALLLHPNLNGNWLTDTAWTLALYLEAVAVYPQITMFSRQASVQQEQAPEPFAANFVFGVAAARVLTFLFWLSSYHELNDKYADALHRRYPGVMVVLSQVVNLLVVADYLFVYMTKAYNKQPLLLPRTI